MDSKTKDTIIRHLKGIVAALEKAETKCCVDSCGKVGVECPECHFAYCDKCRNDDVGLPYSKDTCSRCRR